MTDPLSEEPYPLQSHLGFRLTEWRDGFCRLELPLEAFLMNRNGILHGGVSATLLDTAMGFAGCWTGDADLRQAALTLSLNVNYIGQATGRIVICEATKTGGGRKTFFAQARLTDLEGTLVASATGVFRYRTFEKT